mmetsp:Transcript_27760/g.81199  ORF Transcript_27760/g.81199 Transcript_27760/m.81199 type:complete len:257 (-) Transcript_27760:475-1245(-)
MQRLGSKRRPWNPSPTTVKLWSAYCLATSALSVAMSVDRLQRISRESMGGGAGLCFLGDVFFPRRDAALVGDGLRDRDRDRRRRGDPGSELPDVRGLAGVRGLPGGSLGCGGRTVTVMNSPEGLSLDGPFLGEPFGDSLATSPDKAGMSCSGWSDLASPLDVGVTASGDAGLGTGGALAGSSSPWKDCVTSLQPSNPLIGSLMATQPLARSGLSGSCTSASRRNCMPWPVGLPSLSTLIGLVRRSDARNTCPSSKT